MNLSVLFLIVFLVLAALVAYSVKFITQILLQNLEIKKLKVYHHIYDDNRDLKSINSYRLNEELLKVHKNILEISSKNLNETASRNSRNINYWNDSSEGGES